MISSTSSTSTTSSTTIQTFPTVPYKAPTKHQECYNFILMLITNYLVTEKFQKTMHTESPRFSATRLELSTYITQVATSNPTLSGVAKFYNGYLDELEVQGDYGRVANFSSPHSKFGLGRAKYRELVYVHKDVEIEGPGFQAAVRKTEMLENVSDGELRGVLGEYIVNPWRLLDINVFSVYCASNPNWRNQNRICNVPPDVRATFGIFDEGLMTKFISYLQGTLADRDIPRSAIVEYEEVSPSPGATVKENNNNISDKQGGENAIAEEDASLLVDEAVIERVYDEAKLHMELQKENPLEHKNLLPAVCELSLIRYLQQTMKRLDGSGAPLPPQEISNALHHLVKTGKFTHLKNKTPRKILDEDPSTIIRHELSDLIALPKGQYYLPAVAGKAIKDFISPFSEIEFAVDILRVMGLPFTAATDRSKLERVLLCLGWSNQPVVAELFLRSKQSGLLHQFSLSSKAPRAGGGFFRLPLMASTLLAAYRRLMNADQEANRSEIMRIIADAGHKGIDLSTVTNSVLPIAAMGQQQNQQQQQQHSAAHMNNQNNHHNQHNQNNSSSSSSLQQQPVSEQALMFLTHLKPITPPTGIDKKRAIETLQRKFGVSPLMQHDWLDELAARDYIHFGTSPISAGAIFIFLGSGNNNNNNSHHQSIRRSRSPPSTSSSSNLQHHHHQQQQSAPNNINMNNPYRRTPVDFGGSHQHQHQHQHQHHHFQHHQNQNPPQNSHHHHHHHHHQQMGIMNNNNNNNMFSTAAPVPAPPAAPRHRVVGMKGNNPLTIPPPMLIVNGVAKKRNPAFLLRAPPPFVPF